MIYKAEDLPGVKKKSFSLPFAGGEIWCEHLDGIYEYTNLAIEKLEKDYLLFKKPSMPSSIIINLDETVINDALITAIADKLLYTEKRFTKVAFVGVNRKTKYKIRNALLNAQFAIKFENDFEKAKEWVVSDNII